MESQTCFEGLKQQEISGTHTDSNAFQGCFSQKYARWAPTSYKSDYNPYIYGLINGQPGL